MLSNGSSIQGCVFVSAFNATQTGPESVKDLMNDGPGFFPIEVIEGDHLTIHLVNRQHVLFVTLGSDDELRREPERWGSGRATVAAVVPFVKIS